MKTVWLLWFVDIRRGVKNLAGVFDSENIVKERELELIETTKARGLVHDSDFTAYFYEVEVVGEEGNE